MYLCGGNTLPYNVCLITVNFADEIRQAYRTKAMDNHPDKNPDDPLATQRFQRISKAYRVLAEGKQDQYESII